MLEKGKTVTGRGRFLYPDGCIFLDGAYHGAPFIDNKRRQYSLDHHAGCIRSFTLSACEQAAVLIHEGMPLDIGEWLVVLNDLDLDSILAAWILMNRGELLAGDKELLERLMPLVRLEGAIDVHGFGGGMLTGLPREERARLGALLERLRKVAKGSPLPGEKNYLPVLARALEELDRMIIPPEVQKAMLEFRETGRVGLGEGKIAVMCQSEKGIYDAESWFSGRLGGVLGLLILDQGKGRYTLRLVDRFMRRDLVHLYRRLNAIDPAVTRSRETGNTWGGSREIGGSPRETGTALSPERILELVGETFADSGIRRLFGRLMAGR